MRARPWRDSRAARADEPRGTGQAVMSDIERVQRLLEQGRYGESAARCERLLSARPLHADALELLGVARIGMGRVPEGIVCLENAAALNPGKPGVLERLGEALLRCGQAQRAADAFRRAIERGAPSATLLYNLGLAQQSAQDSAGAMDSYRRCLALNPQLAEAHNNLGTLLDLAGRPTEAIDCFNAALTCRPDYVRALTNLGKVQRQVGHAAEAIDTLEKALAAAPDHPPALGNLAAALADLERPDEAAERARRAIELEPRIAEAHFHLGRALLARGEAEAAIASLREAVTLKPDLTDAQVLLAHTLLQDGRLAAAMQQLYRAIAVKSELSDLHVLLGIALFRAERVEEAIASLDRALAIDPGCLKAHLFRSWALQYLNRFMDAAQSCEQAAALVRDDPEIMSSLLVCYTRTCDWQRAAQQLQRIREAPQGLEGANPFVLLGLSDDPAEQLRAARGWGAHLLSGREPLGATVRYDHRRIRIAYLSSDFYNHATSFLIAELFELHDRAAFEIFAASFGPDDQSAIRSRIAAACNEFMDVRGSSDREIARALREREIDILVDLKGYTAWARAEILAYRPAPVQVNYLGYPGTMGVSLVDYLIADRFLIPADERRFYSESIVYLPDSYQANDRRRAAAAANSARGDWGLPDDAFVFCSFGNAWKITEPVFEVWMRLLQAIPGSVLWLLDGNQWSDVKLRAEALRAGVEPGRLVFSPRAASAVHLERHRHADLFLDTIPVNAHTSASDALWCGVPVVTCAGRSFAARVAGSLLHAVRSGELIAASLEEYEQLACALAQDRSRLRRIRARLLRDREILPLFDTPVFCRHLESAYQRMWAMQQRGEAPRDITIERAAR
jgi:protein O-GlcNAc transferase